MRKKLLNTSLENLFLCTIEKQDFPRDVFIVSSKHLLNHILPLILAGNANYFLSDSRREEKHRSLFFMSESKRCETRNTKHILNHTYPYMLIPY